MARPKANVDAKRVETLASNMCTMEEIAADQKCSVDTLERRFAEVIKRGQELARLSLRARQFGLAMGREARPAEYLREQTRADGSTYGELVKDKDGNPIKVRDALPEIRPHPGMLYWLGKQYLGQADTLKLQEGDGFEFAPRAKA